MGIGLENGRLLSFQPSFCIIFLLGALIVFENFSIKGVTDEI